MCVTGRKKLNQLHIVLLVIGMLICVHVDCCYCLLFDLVISIVVQFGIVIRIRLVALEAIILGGAKKILGCSSKTCNEAVRGDMGLN